MKSIRKVQKLKFGVIGADPTLRAGIVFRDFPREQGELTALCDRDPEMLRRFAEAYPDMKPETFPDYKSFLKKGNIDAVFIMVRDQYHEEMAVAALKAGKAVFLEKPMAITIEGCDHILRTAYETGSKLFIGHNMRYMPVVLKMKEIIDSGVIGKIQSVWCRHFVNYGSCYFRHFCAEQETCNGLLLQKGAHDIDVIHWLTGGYSTRVVAMGRLSVYNRNPNRLKPGEKPDRKASFGNDCWPPLEIKGLASHIDVEDHSMILMSLDNGIQASYEQCMYAPDSCRNYTFIGDHGRIENVGDVGDCEVRVWTGRGNYTEPDVVHHLKAQNGTHGGADAPMLKAFFDFVQFDQKPNVSAIAARNAVAAGCMGHYSMRNGSVPQDIPQLDPKLIRYFENGQTAGKKPKK